MTVIAEHDGWKLITFNEHSGYKIIRGFKCYYEYERRANAIKRFNQLTGRA